MHCLWVSKHSLHWFSCEHIFLFFTFYRQIISLFLLNHSLITFFQTRKPFKSVEIQNSKSWKLPLKLLCCVRLLCEWRYPQTWHIGPYSGSNFFSFWYSLLYPKPWRNCELWPVYFYSSVGLSDRSLGTEWLKGIIRRLAYQEVGHLVSSRLHPDSLFQSTENTSKVLDFNMRKSGNWQWL